MILLCKSKIIVKRKTLKKIKKYLKFKYFEFIKFPSNNIIKADLAIPEDLGECLSRKILDDGSYPPYIDIPPYKPIIFG